MPDELTRALVRQGLNRTRADPVDEAQRRAAKREFCAAFAAQHPEYAVSALAYAVSAGRSSDPDTFAWATRRAQLKEWGSRYGEGKSQAANVEHALWFKEARKES